MVRCGTKAPSGNFCLSLGVSWTLTAAGRLWLQSCRVRDFRLSADYSRVPDPLHRPSHSTPAAFQPKVARTGAWSLVPTSFWTVQADARAANELLANT